MPAAVSRAARAAVTRPGAGLPLTAGRSGRHDARDLILQRTPVGLTSDERGDDIADFSEPPKGLGVA
jgi:hypothetical protein